MIVHAPCGQDDYEECTVKKYSNSRECKSGVCAYTEYFWEPYQFVCRPAKGFKVGTYCYWSSDCYRASCKWRYGNTQRYICGG